MLFKLARHNSIFYTQILGVYSISKTTLLALCKTAAEDLASEGIRVNCIAPGVIKTKFSEAVCIFFNSRKYYFSNIFKILTTDQFQMYETKEAHDTTISLIPMQRLGTSDEIGSVAAFLASDDASYITGETIVAAGGMKSRLQEN